MNPHRLLQLLQDVADGTAAPAEIVRQLTDWPVENVADEAHEPWARLDHHRTLRTGMPEVVFGAGKTATQVVEICKRLAAHGDGFLVTRADESTRDALSLAFENVLVNDSARTVHLPGRTPFEPPDACIAVVSAGTADLPVAEEAAVTAHAFGLRVDRIYDVGVAGLHRVLTQAERLRSAAAVIVVAGMEGALPSVVGGLVPSPVIAVPTSVGYGAAFGGLAALLGMLNSCAAGVTVVNIDNGFGAACAASRILRSRHARST